MPEVAEMEPKVISAGVGAFWLKFSGFGLVRPTYSTGAWVGGQFTL